jgi:hypothetical protein
MKSSFVQWLALAWTPWRPGDQTTCQGRACGRGGGWGVCVQTWAWGWAHVAHVPKLVAKSQHFSQHFSPTLCLETEIGESVPSCQPNRTRPVTCDSCTSSYYCTLIEQASGGAVLHPGWLVQCSPLRSCRASSSFHEQQQNFTHCCSAISISIQGCTPQPNTSHQTTKEQFVISTVL